MSSIFLKYGFLLLATLFSLSACGERENLNDKPVSYWINDQDSCVSATAQAIVDSGEPYPNFIYENRTNPKTGKQERIKLFDLWLGTERYRIPADYIYYHGGYAKNHPYRYMGLRGTLPNFYPKGPSAEVKDGMAAMVDIRFGCSMKKSYEESLGAQSNEEGISKYTQRIQKRAKEWRKHTNKNTTEVTVSFREDLNMTEVLWDQYTNKNPKREGLNGGWQAAYWPNKNEMKSFGGATSGISCDIRHDPIEKRYNGRGWRCSSALRVNKNVSAKIQIYVSHLAAMPSIHQQVKQLLIDSKIEIIGVRLN